MATWSAEPRYPSAHSAAAYNAAPATMAASNPAPCKAHTPASMSAALYAAALWALGYLGSADHVAMKRLLAQ